MGAAEVPFLTGDLRPIYNAPMLGTHQLPYQMTSKFTIGRL